VTFEEAMSAVEVELVFPERLEDFHNRRTQKLFEETGLLEQLSGTPTVAVTGTCGKASTAHYLANAVARLFRLTGSTKEVGLGTKPPLLETLDGNRERYQLASGEQKRWIEPHEFVALVEQLPPLPAGLAPYDLRYWILGRWFVERQVGLAIVEANIGFRLDPVSLFPNPVAQLLTPIGSDHPGLLQPFGAPDEVLALGEQAGPTWHKACCPTSELVVSGRQSPQVAEIIERYNPNLELWGRDFKAEVLDQSLAGSEVRIQIAEEPAFTTSLQTVGRHQAENAAQAAACVWELWKRGVLPGEAGQVIEAIRCGLANTFIPGRMERLRRDPPVLLNAAAGVIKTEGMMSSLEELLGSERCLWIIMSVQERLVGESITPWLDRSLRRIVQSPITLGFTATAAGQDMPAPLLAQWAAQRADERVTVEHHDSPLIRLSEVQEKAGVVVLLGQSRAELRGKILSMDSAFKMTEEFRDLYCN